MAYICVTLPVSHPAQCLERLGMLQRTGAWIRAPRIKLQLHLINQMSCQPIQLSAIKTTTWHLLQKCISLKTQKLIPRRKTNHHIWNRTRDSEFDSIGKKNSVICSQGVRRQEIISIETISWQIFHYIH